jgi:hypothetical protein
MTDISGLASSSWLVLVGLILVCFIIIIVISRIETKYNKVHHNIMPEFFPGNAGPGDSSKENNYTEFVVGQVYRMQDGTLAKYAGDGKFYKIKE